MRKPHSVLLPPCATVDIDGQIVMGFSSLCSQWFSGCLKPHAVFDAAPPCCGVFIHLVPFLLVLRQRSYLFASSGLSDCSRWRARRWWMLQRRHRVRAGGWRFARSAPSVELAINHTVHEGATHRASWTPAHAANHARIVGESRNNGGLPTIHAVRMLAGRFA